MTATPPIKYNDLCNIIESDRLLEFIASSVFAADSFLPTVVISKRLCVPETLKTFCLAVEHLDFELLKESVNSCLVLSRSFKYIFT